MPELRPAVFLDRDGTLNTQIVRDGRPYPPPTPQEFRLFDGVRESCRALHLAGFTLVVVTNQPDVVRGTQQQAIVEQMHAKLQSLVPEISRIEVCYDDGGAESRRRKPAPGMILDAAAALGLDLPASWIIGDRWRDVDCGRRAGVRSVFIDHGYAEALRERPDFVVADFRSAAAIVIEQGK